MASRSCSKIILESLEPRQLLSANVTLNPTIVHQTIRGFGGDAARVVWAKDDAADDPTGQFLLNQLKPALVRVGIPWKQWEPINDNADPNLADPAGFLDAARVHNEFLYMQQLQAKGITLIATAWEAPAWMLVPATNPLGGPTVTIPDAMFDEAAESLTQYLVRARDVYGVNIPYVSFNESNFGIQIFMPADRMAKWIAASGARFAAAGLNTKWLVGDTFSTDSLVAYAAPILADTAAQPYEGPISYHSWWAEGKPDSIFTAIADLAKQYNKEVWSPEVGYDALLGHHPEKFPTWDNALRLAKVYNRVLKFSQASVALYWEYQIVDPSGADPNDFPLVANDLTPYPAYYIVKQLSDNLPAGAQMLDVTSDNSSLMTLAGKDPATGNYMLQVINAASTANTVSFHNLPAANFAIERTSATENLSTVGTFAPVAGDVTLTLPAQSVTLLTTLGQPPLATQTPFSGQPIALPATIQAENYDKGGEGVAYHDTTAANQGGAYRTTEAVDVEPIAAGGFALDFAKAGEWTEYTINAPTAGNFDLAVRYAALSAGGKFHLEIDGKTITPSLAIQATGGWQTYRNLTTGPITLTAGQHVLRLAMDANGGSGYVANFDSLQFTAHVSKPASTPFRGTPFNIGDTIRAEDFDNGGEGVAFHDTTAANEGGAAYRSTAVDLQTTTDTGGGYIVGFTHAGEWLNYTINVATAGTYRLDARLAALASGGLFHVEFDGVNATGSIAVPGTGGWQTWQTLTSSSFSLTTGTHVMRIVFDRNQSNGFAGNFNWFKLHQ